MIINITDFGANANSPGLDSAHPIKMALEYAKTLNCAVTLDFPKGEYYLTEKSEEKFMVYCDSMQDITFRGNGSKLHIMTPFSGVFLFRKCTNITVDGFEIEYQTPPWTQGEVIAADTESGEIVYLSEEGYDVFSMEQYTSYTAPWGAILDSENPHMLRPDAPEHFKFSHVESLGNRTYKAIPEDPDLVKNGVLRKGDKIVYTCRQMSGSVVAAFSTKNITVENMLVHECGDCLFVAAYIEGKAVIRNYRTEFRGNNYIVSVADGVHIQGSRASVTIEDCSFEGLLDDCVNLYQYPGKIAQIISETEIKIVMPEKNLPRAGETMMIYHPQTQQEKMRFQVNVVKEINQEHTTCIVEIEMQSKNIEEGDTFCIEECMAPGSTIHNNRFSLSRRYGLLLKSKDTVVRNNVFEHLGADAVNFAANVSDFRKEGPYSENVVVENNKINNVCYRNGRKYKNRWASGACIGIYKYNRNIRVYENTFQNPPAYHISYGSEEEGIHIK